MGTRASRFARRLKRQSSTVSSQESPNNEEEPNMSQLLSSELHPPPSAPREDGLASNNEVKYKDEELALALQTEFDDEHAKKCNDEELCHLTERLTIEEESMQLTTTGRALRFVQDVVESLTFLDRQTSNAEGTNKPLVSLIDPAYLVQHTEKFMIQFAAFKDAGISTAIDFGYHFTSEENMNKIHTYGLLSKPDRESRSINSAHHGSQHGEGVYTADDTTYAGNGKYGNACLLVARLQGGMSNTVRKLIVKVLKQSSQSLAMVQIDWNRWKSCNPHYTTRLKEMERELAGLFEKHFE